MPVQYTGVMLKITKILLTLLSLVPIFAFARIETNVEMPKAIQPIQYSKEYSISIIKEVWGKDTEIGLGIAKCESGFNNLAVNYTDSKLNGHVSRGLFQMSEINGVIPLWYEPKVNAEKAYSMFLKQGARPWTNCAIKLGLF